MSVSWIKRFVDERFLAHRLRSTSRAGVATALVAGLLFEYRLIVTGVVSWDLFAVTLTFVVIKLGLMLWYSLTH
jgi:hypothetical protein